MPRRAKPWYRKNEDTWYATVNGRKTSLKVRGRENEAAAWRAWEAARTGSPLPCDPVPAAVGSRQRPASQVRVREVIRAFLDDAAGRVTPSTQELYRLFLTGFSKTHGALPVSSLTCPLAETYSRRPNWSDSTRAAFLAVLARAFFHAERLRLIDRTPLLGLRKPPIASRAADVMITAEQHAKLLAASEPRFREMLTFLFLTGCRPSEAAQLVAADVDFCSGTATVRNHKTSRKGKRRVLYLTPSAVEMLLGLAARNPTGPLFRNRIGKPWTRATIGMAMRKARTAAGLQAAIAYGYRHGFATDALAAGVPDAQVAELLGHSSTAMLHKHYSHLATRVKLLTNAVKAVR